MFVEERRPSLSATAECTTPIVILHATPSATPPCSMSGVSSLTSAIHAVCWWSGLYRGFRGFQVQRGNTSLSNVGVPKRMSLNHLLIFGPGQKIYCVSAMDGPAKLKPNQGPSHRRHGAARKDHRT